jgi:transposase
MDANILFGQALGLGSGWKVVKSEMNVAGRELKIWLDFESGSQFACPRCGAFCPIHDTVEKKWRHLDFWQHRTELIARVPRTHCEEHGILQAAVPWARPGSGFTLMMEAMILLLGQQMSVSAAARHLGESDKRLWRVLEHYVMEAHADKDCWTTSSPSRLSEPLYWLTGSPTPSWSSMAPVPPTASTEATRCTRSEG